MAYGQKELIEIYEGRVTADFLLQQRNYSITQESFSDRRERQQDSDSLYQGHLKPLFPDESALEDHMFIENKFKNALHDHSRLASEGKGNAKFIPRGDRTADKIGARVREAIVDTYWAVGRGEQLRRRLFMDEAGDGYMAVVAYYNDESVYPQFSRLDPRFCFPDIRNGKLHNLIYIETMYERVAAMEHPNIGLNFEADDQSEVEFLAYYDKDEVCECFIRKTDKDHKDQVYIVQRWIHNLGRVPVAYHQMATFDGVPRGLFDQLAGPMMVRNKSVRFGIDYMEQAAYSPLFALNIENATEVPGPLTVYRGDPDAEPGTVHLERIGPAVAGGTLWNLISYMADQEEKEATQPATRTGQVPQSQASGSFVDSTQGTLTSVVIELEDGMADLRVQLNEICMLIDEKWLDTSKPLIRAVGKKRTYSPSKDIAGWYYHTIEFGAGAGLGKLNTDNRVLNHVAGRLIDRGTAMEQIDYISDSSSIQEKIDAENVGDALLQRFATDPTTPIASLAKLEILMEDEGLSKIEALKQVAPELFVPPEAQTQPQPGTQPPGTPPGTPGTQPQPEGALPAPGAGETPTPQLPKASMQQLFGNQGIRR